MSNPIENNKQCSFFRWIRDNTFYNAFKRALIDSQSLSNSDESLLEALHLLLVIGFTLLLLALAVNLYYISGPVNSNLLGTFGDFIGGSLNPIFTLMTFFGVIVTIALQKLELRAAREEYKKSADALGTQAVENTFFNMLNLHHRITENLNFPDLDFDIDGDGEAISFESSISSNINKYNGTSAFTGFLHKVALGNRTKDEVLSIYAHIQNYYNHIFGHYFRNLYQIMKFVDEHTIIENHQKKKYMSILRAQLSTGELSVLFMNCSGSMVDNGEFRKLLIKYKMLEHMNLTYNPFEFSLTGKNKRKNSPYKTVNNISIADDESISEYLSTEPGGVGAFGQKNIRLPKLDNNI